ncbi:MAG: hypothetical protein HZC14_01515 [Candidatus Niyogibacteria bacterium]|nr:hypothetical protein [Candidatus Niyogibacteria bacterium]
MDIELQNSYAPKLIFSSSKGEHLQPPYFRKVAIATQIETPLIAEKINFSAFNGVL